LEGTGNRLAFPGENKQIWRTDNFFQRKQLRDSFLESISLGLRHLLKRSNFASGAGCGAPLGYQLKVQKALRSKVKNKLPLWGYQLLPTGLVPA
jgi:hypothetical protein